MAIIGSSGQAPTLLAFPPSLDRELARFLLKHYGISYSERLHTLIFGSIAAKRATGKKPFFSVLYNDRYSLATVSDVIYYCESGSAPQRRLFPRDPAGVAQMEQDWKEIYDTFSFATTTWAYYYLVPRRDLLLDPLTDGVPGYEKQIVRLGWPFFAGLLKSKLNLTPQNAEKCLAEIRRTFDAMDRRLGNGRRFLIGDRLSLSDILFAVMAAPVVLPENYGGPMPALSDMPAELKTVIEELREREAGRFVRRIYRDYR